MEKKNNHLKEKIKQSILEIFQENSDYSFSELENIGLQVKGDRALYLRENLIIWENTNSDFNNAITDLEKEDKIFMEPLSKMDAMVIYSYEGEFLDLPIGNIDENYSSSHWVPMIIKIK